MRYITIIAAVLLAACSPTKEERITAITQETVLREAEKVLIPELMTRAGLQYDERVLPWVRGYEYAKSTPGVMVYSMARNDEREKLFKWAVPVLPVEYAFYKRVDRTDVFVGQLSDAKQYEVEVHLSGSAEAILREHGFDVEKIRPKDKTIESLTALVGGRIDLYFGSHLNVLRYCKAHQDDCAKIHKAWQYPEKGQFWIAFNADTPDDIIKRVQKAHKTMIEDGTWGRVIKPYEPKKQ